MMISHNMADVMAVADRVAVLRLGRNNGVFGQRRPRPRTSSPRSPARPTTRSPSAQRAGAGRRAPHHELPGSDRIAGPTPRTRRYGRDARGGRHGPQLPADLQDERLIASQGVSGAVWAPSPPGCAPATWARSRSCRRPDHHLGGLPDRQQLVPVQPQPGQPHPADHADRVIALGIVLVLLLGEIDLSVGSVSGLRSFWPSLGGTAMGFIQGFFFAQDRRTGVHRDAGRPPRLERPACCGSSARPARINFRESGITLACSTRAPSSPTSPSTVRTGWRWWSCSAYVPALGRAHRQPSPARRRASRPARSVEIILRTAICWRSWPSRWRSCSTSTRACRSRWWCSSLCSW
jgi:hypothetical protein